MVEFSLAETLMVEMALQAFLRREMSKSDREICKRALMKVEIGAKGAQIRELLKEDADR